MPTSLIAAPQTSWLRGLLVWPARLWEPWTAPEDLPEVTLSERFRRLQHHRPPEGWLALQPGLATVGDARTWTSFVARGATALAVGGVHGPDRLDAYRQFRSHAAALGLSRQAVYPVRAADLDAAAQAGFRTVPVAVESWVDLADFTLQGKGFADLRQMRNRAHSRGVQVHEVDPAAWRGPIEETWQRFQDAKVPWQVRWLSGSPVYDDSWGHRTFVAHLDGRLQAFVTVLPGPDSTSGLDVMCRDPDAVPGSMDLLLVRVLEQLGSEGQRAVSLGPSPLAGDSVAEVDGLLGAAMRWAWGSETGNRWFGFRRLATFKQKFQPRQETVHLGVSPSLSPVSLYLVARIWALGD